MKLTPEMESELAQAIQQAAACRLAGDASNAWAALERAHVISQPSLLPHLRVHQAMLSLAVNQREVKEVAGQLLRLTLAPLGHVLGRTPWGNSGRSNISMFARAALSDDVARLYSQAGVKVK
jgi:hypothetical protein